MCLQEGRYGRWVGNWGHWWRKVIFVVRLVLRYWMHETTLNSFVNHSVMIFFNVLKKCKWAFNLHHAHSVGTSRSWLFCLREAGRQMSTASPHQDTEELRLLLVSRLSFSSPRWTPRVCVPGSAAKMQTWESPEPNSYNYSLRSQTCSWKLLKMCLKADLDLLRWWTGCPEQMELWEVKTIDYFVYF